MDHGYFRYDEPYAGPKRRKANLFAWTIVILLLTGMMLAAWLGSFYIFGQPERPDSYRILQKLGKVEQPKRFQLTAAPSGEFLTSKRIYERYHAMRPAELAKTNAELARNFIRNFQNMAGQVPYVVGRFTIMEARELGPNDLFTSGMVALTNASDYGELLLEHVYPADAQAVPLMKQTLVTGLEIKLERLHDLSAVIHVERLRDGRLLLTAVPLLYGSYTVTQGLGTFSLEPPFDLNMDAGWPIFKEPARRAAEERFAHYRQKVAPPATGIPLPGLSPEATPSAPTNELVRIETAIAVTPRVAEVTPTPEPEPTATPKGGKLAKGKKASPSPAPAAVAAASPDASPPAGSTPATVAAAAPAAEAQIATPPAAPTAAPITPTANMALASTAGVANWKTFPPGKMPAGRLITTGDLQDLADRGMAGERVYLRGQFVVNFAESNRAVLRPRSGVAQSVLRLGAPSSTRVIVEFPAGRPPPEQGSVVNRDEQRPYEITEVRRQADGQLNVFVREIMQ
ncbi:MAG: hypothetical protein H0V56_05185 [Chthoniobacterales bacterium]|nr:hypothetical protein [Chthoniobacterales bacterium]